ncbi:MAG: hypothetical protein WD048_12145 [Chitinophagales bacterium]
MKFKVSKADKKLIGEIDLEGSKSISNRILIIRSLCQDPFTIKHISESDDTIRLYELMKSKDIVLNAGEGGTTIRFLLALLATHDGQSILTGSDSLLKRPIAPLVDALNELGADIQYLGYKGYPPLLVQGKKFESNRVEIDAGISSQFISALLLVAPVLPKGLVLKLKGNVVSSPYIRLTLEIMRYFGIRCEWSQNLISIPHQDYSARDIQVESDWSAASYYYEMAALADEVDLQLNGLYKHTGQGDAEIHKIMQGFGVVTTFNEKGVRLSKGEATQSFFRHDFKNSPDLVQTMLATCAGLNIPAQITGVDTLMIKETNRMKAMQRELDDLGFYMNEHDGKWNLGTAGIDKLSPAHFFNTYSDHRMAMSLTPLCLRYGTITVDNPYVVTKSYPGFWEDLISLGFEVVEQD